MTRLTPSAQILAATLATALAFLPFVQPAEAVPACVSIETAQATIDATPNGAATAADLKTKLRYGPGPFALVNLGCVTGPGILTVENRQGLWFRSAGGPGVVWELTASEAVVLTNPEAAAVIVAGGSSRVETYKTAGGQLAVSGGLVYAGKVFVASGSFHAVSGFVRGSGFAEGFAISGEMEGFAVVGVAGTLTNTATGNYSIR